MKTGYMTAWLDLAPELQALMANMRGNWRNALRKALADPPVLRFSSRHADIDDFTKVYLENRKIHRHSTPSARLVKCLSEAFGRDVRLFRAMEHRETVASSLFPRHGRSAIYYLSWTTERGRALNAVHFILWEAIRTLRGDGFHWLNLDGNNARARSCPVQAGSRRALRILQRDVALTRVLATLHA
ncbi:MAG: GNAT family N-acetyltransferase [Alphaproteobacteria bacterium]|jgi:lipid II:glycine glycyltransferase (peptidoglycan interpeptide bridge formation enzyme)